MTRSTLDRANTLLWELRAMLEEWAEAGLLTEPGDMETLNELRAFTRQQLSPVHKLTPTGDANRDRLVAARLDLRA